MQELSQQVAVRSQRKGAEDVDDPHLAGVSGGIRKTERGKRIYAQRKETIERVFADAKEKHAMRYTHHRGLAAVTRWVRLKYAAMNLKKLAKWSWENSIFSKYIVLFNAYIANPPVFAWQKPGVL